MSTKSSRRQRTKCFTGCWTCRARRVKCDEHRPHCSRCTKSGFPCQGYGVRLSWAQEGNSSENDGPNIGSSRPARRLMMPTGVVTSPSPQALSPPDVNATLSFDNDPPDDDGSVFNGDFFSVFPVPLSSLNGDNGGSSSSTARLPPAIEQGTLTRDNDISRSPLTCSPSNHLGNLPTPSHSPSRLPGETRIKEAATRRVEIPRQIERGTSNPANTHGVSEDPSSDEDADTSWQDDSSNITLAEPSAENEARERQTPNNSNDLKKHGKAGGDGSVQQLNGSHLDLLLMPAHQKRLIHHFVTFLSSKLLLIDEPHNPCKTKMLPMALKGLMSSSTQSSAEIAVFHTICALSAYNLFELHGGEIEHDRTLAMKHDQLSILHLRHSVASNDESDDCAIGMTIMACFGVEAVSAIPRRWRTHMTGGLDYLATLRSRRARSQSTLQFQRDIVCMAILSDFDVPQEVAAYLDDAGDLEQLCCCDGLSANFVRTVAMTNRILTSKQACSLKELDSFELQLYLDFPQTRRAGSNTHHDTILHHMDKAFYYAGLVFFQRAVRRASLEAVQSLVEQGLGELEAIEEITKGSSGCIIMWPCLVLTAECASTRLQSRGGAWFKEKQKLGFRNVVVLYEVVKTIWLRRANASAPSDITWQDVVKEESFDVFRL